MKRLFPVARLEARHQHPDVPDRVRRIGLAELQKKTALCGIDIEQNFPRLLRRNRGVVEGDLSGAVVKDGVLARRKTARRERAKRGLGGATGLELFDPAFCIQLKLRAFAPRLAFALADPLPRMPEHIDKRKLRAEIRRTGEIHSETRRRSRRVGRRA